MEKKLYHVIDPETGKIIEKRYVGGLGKLLYQMVAMGWGKVLRWTFRIVLLLCVVLTVTESILRERFPAFYDGMDEIVFIGDLLALREVILAVRRFFRRKTQKEVEKLERLYQIIDPETGKVVGTQRSEEKEKQVDTTARGYRFSHTMYYFTETCFLLTLLAFVSILFIPEDWHPIFGIAGVIFMLFWGFGRIIWHYKLYEIGNEKVDKFELTMARLTLVCAFLAVPFGIAALVLPGDWARYAATLTVILAFLAAIGNSVWRSEERDRKNGNKKG